MGGEHEVTKAGSGAIKTMTLKLSAEYGVTRYFSIKFPDNSCGSLSVGWFWFPQSHVLFSFLSPISPFSPSPPAFEYLASSLVKQEMANMPRGIYHSALRGGAVRSDQGKTVSGVPSFMLKMYERNKQPGLKAGLAGKFLLAFLKLGGS